MEQRVSLITLGVKDLGVARRFYEHLGWNGQEAGRWRSTPASHWDDGNLTVPVFDDAEPPVVS